MSTYLDLERFDSDLAKCLHTDRLLRVGHRIADSGLFEDAALIELLDGYPRSDTVIQTMGELPATDTWRQGTIGNLPGEAIFEAIRAGRLWLNLKSLHVHRETYASLLRDLYDELASVAGRAAPKWKTMGLLLSSPTASVPFHADVVPNALWQIRGRKRVFVYPAQPPFVPFENLERICAGEEKEELPFDPSFDEAAIQIDMGPGEAVFWPQHSPHRVVNLEGLNVSLSTEHLLAESRRLVRVHRANSLLRRQLGLRPTSCSTRGLAALFKSCLATSQSVLRRLRRRAPVSYDQTPLFDVDPKAHEGLRERSG